MKMEVVGDKYGNGKIIIETPNNFSYFLAAIYRVFGLA